ncbi:hypothetical protein SKAU_G00163880 [Synaphobranchus kaupii]|uniref:Uncharacterized protein n=1 Tax=Synaphobranchus kaupii TaxID=118154 RepID=A0A9Q1FJ84_SYNKA|nr:hypothetical protein SKAU_G00163880 [Synaphobranchus kaupii]
MAGKVTAQGTGILLVTANVGSLFEDQACFHRFAPMPVCLSLMCRQHCLFTKVPETSPEATARASLRLDPLNLFHGARAQLGLSVYYPMCRSQHLTPGHMWDLVPYQS